MAQFDDGVSAAANLQHPWQVVDSPAGRRFWLNSTTGETRALAPVGPPPGPPPTGLVDADAVAAAERYAAPDDGEDGLAAAVVTARISDEQPPPPTPPPAHWTRYVDDASGRPYWHDAMSGLTTWDDPAAFAGSPADDRLVAAEAPPRAVSPPLRVTLAPDEHEQEVERKVVDIFLDPAYNEPMMIAGFRNRDDYYFARPLNWWFEEGWSIERDITLGYQRGGPPTKFFVLVRKKPLPRARQVD